VYLLSAPVSPETRACASPRWEQLREGAARADLGTDRLTAGPDQLDESPMPGVSAVAPALAWARTKEVLTA
jgi:hypothetical protein